MVSGAAAKVVVARVAEATAAAATVEVVVAEACMVGASFARALTKVGRNGSAQAQSLIW